MSTPDVLIFDDQVSDEHLKLVRLAFAELVTTGVVVQEIRMTDAMDRLELQLRNLSEMEIGNIARFRLITSEELDFSKIQPVPPALPITYGPVRKGRGGKVRRW